MSEIVKLNPCPECGGMVFIGDDMIVACTQCKRRYNPVTKRHVMAGWNYPMVDPLESIERIQQLRAYFTIGMVIMVLNAFLDLDGIVFRQEPHGVSYRNNRTGATNSAISYGDDASAIRVCFRLAHGLLYHDGGDAFDARFRPFLEVLQTIIG